MALWFNNDTIFGRNSCCLIIIADSSNWRVQRRSYTSHIHVAERLCDSQAFSGVYNYIFYIYHRVGRL